ncbi:MAG: B12-binding domain-containing radical SAM protein [Myxococcales bacterium]
MTLLRAEQGRIERDAPNRIALVYPSPYHVGMSSLGYQTIYRMLQSTPDFCAERVFLPDDTNGGGNPEPIASLESNRTLGDFSVLALSVAYELEIASMVRLFELANLAPVAALRTERDPLVIAGGPLTFSNPRPLLPFVDVLVVGEAEELLPFILDALRQGLPRRALLEHLSNHPHLVVPSVNPDKPLHVARADDQLLPAYSAIRTPHTELSDMFLVEVERGCSRGCQYCVMRRSTNGGMRILDKDRVLGLVPEEANKVGLVGAAVSDHPAIVEIVSELAERGKRVGLSSLRPDKLKEPFVRALAQAGYRTLTTALDGPSKRMRESIDRRSKEDHYTRAAELARQNGMDRLKLYLMIGLPGETDQDIDECAEFVSSLSRILPIALGISPFCAKRNTPLDRTPFAGISLVQSRLQRLRRKLAGRADVRATSARWAWVEHVLAQGDVAEGLAVAEAVRQGGSFSDYRRVFEQLGHRTDAKPAHARDPTLPLA